MRHEWLSVEIREHSQQGTAVYRAVLPQSNVAHVQNASVSAMIAQLLECWHCLEAGMTIEVEVSLSMPTSLELDDKENDIVAHHKRRKGLECWQRSFLPSHPKGV